MSAANLNMEDRKHSIISYSVTIVVHALILFLLWCFVIMPPNPPLGEAGGSGSLISLGFENMGGPDIVPVDVTPTPPQPTPEQTTEENRTLTQDNEDAPTIENKVEKKETVVKKAAKKTEKPVKETPKIDKRSLFTKKNNSGTSSGSGSGAIPGNEGRPDGDQNGRPDGNGKNGNGGNGEGFGTGNGVGNGNGDGVADYELKGRSLQRKPNVNDNSRETGKVVVAITVDRNGKVIKAVPGQKGTTTLSPHLLDLSKQGAMDAHFSPKSDGPEEQYGTMTFIFRFKQ